ncbi:uncharacterized protein LOC132057941 [Lycium ferocissimum]|uniref:uncharacterized protein LOC132057941 n=1 Tax=Lycium ferocissimum TaxID=112874 RepID=UPI0028156FE2|nr:uncharacterized protein LOC132057941 [Lycium ferocissimum]
MKLALLNASRRQRRSFKYCNVWASHPLFLNKVKEGWDQEIAGCSMFKVVKKLKVLKKNLRDLNGQHFRNILTEADEDRAALNLAQKALQLNPSDLTLQITEREQCQKFRRTSYLAEVYLQQRSKTTWIKLGDDNTRYFFSVIKHRKLQQAILQLKDKNGQLHTDQAAIAEILVDYYKNLLGKKERDRIIAYSSLLNNGYTLSTEDQMKLIQPYLATEVKKAMFSIDKNKSPGPDGCSNGSFKIHGRS